MNTLLCWAPASDSPWSVALGSARSLVRDLMAALPNLGIALIVFLLFYLVGKAVRAIIRRLADRHRKRRNVAYVLGRLSQGAILILGALIACVIVFPNFTPASLVQLLGISSVAIGFAFRDVLQNYLSGILILLTEPFRLGDQIVFKSYEGTVEDVQTRATVIRTYDGRRVVIPNSELFTNSVMVNTAFEKRRLEYDVGVGFGDDVERARKIILETLAGLAEVEKDPKPDVLLMELADSSVKLRVRWWVRPPKQNDALAARDAALTAIKRALGEHGIDLPFPTTQVLFHDQTDELDGLRGRQREGWPSRSDGEAPRSRSIGGALWKIAEIARDGAARRREPEAAEGDEEPAPRSGTR